MEKHLFEKIYMNQYKADTQEKQLEIVRDNRSNLLFLEAPTTKTILEVFKEHPQLFKLVKEKAKERFNKQSSLAFKPMIKRGKKRLIEYKKYLNLEGVDENFIDNIKIEHKESSYK